MIPIIILIICVGVIWIVAKIETFSKEKNNYPKNNTFYENHISNIGNDKLSIVLDKYYPKIINTLSNLNIRTEIEPELISVIFVILEIVLTEKKERIITEMEMRELVENYVSWIDTQPNANYKLKIFDERLKFYKKIICDEIPLRCEWLMWQKPQKNDAITKSIVAFGDILFNPACAKNYDNAPVMIRDIFTISNFSNSMMRATDILTNLAKEVSLFNFH